MMRNNKSGGFSLPPLMWTLARLASFPGLPSSSFYSLIPRLCSQNVEPGSVTLATLHHLLYARTVEECLVQLSNTTIHPVDGGKKSFPILSVRLEYGMFAK